MARNKVKLQYIRNNTRRRNALRKRCDEVLRKVKELSVLCGGDACVVIYSPEEAAPLVWPEAEDARRILTTFNNLPEHERSRNMVNHETFMQELVAKERDKLAKLERDNFNNEVRVTLYEGFQGSDFAGVSEEYLRPAEAALDDMISKVISRINLMRFSGTESGAALGPVIAQPAPAVGEVGPSTLATRGQDSEFSCSSSEISEVGESNEEEEEEE